ncbi:hypothetical protein BTA51_25530 [Hahella sp. CCB-MM4]|uniref:hypothetical protein n=1 Tax=Hahella sp. (strain CCB-MM4) TaxID=1926491 RepID=UPI000B9B7A93|nr:hypothetical protein [Hahella sp. CCB-MM4]OZG70498.1 hypothetical protein BTA51_25530 [Hahella sp. CCB-MM4]
MTAKNSPITLHQFCKAFWELESRHNLLDLKVGDVYIWQAVRMNAYYLIAQKKNVLEQPHSTPLKTSFNHKLKRLLRKISKIVRDPIFNKVRMIDNKNAATCIVEHPRTKHYKNTVCDIYTESLLEDRELSSNLLLLDNNTNQKSQKTYHPCRRDLGFTDAISDALGTVISIALSFSSNAIKLRKLQEAIIKEFQINALPKNYLLTHYSKFVVRRFLIKTVFRIYQIKTLYIVVSYQHAAIISAAKKLGIKVIELQHGTFSKYHLGYSFPNLQTTLHYFPDYFGCWSEFWRQQFTRLASPASSYVHGFPYLYDSLAKYKNVQKIPMTIAVASQGVLGNRLASVLMSHAYRLRKFKITYKLHPGEYGRWKEYEAFKNISLPDNITVVEDCDLYTLLAESEFIIGVFSTAIFEGLELGAKPVLVDLPGIEYMEDLLVTGNALQFNQFLDEYGTNA